MADWLMVIITTVYAIATIFICVYNYRSTKATREQVAESIRQFEESNRAFITASFEVVRVGALELSIANHGKRIARNVKIKVNKEFVNLTSTDAREAIEKLAKSEFSIGIDQKWQLFLGVYADLKDLKTVPLQLEITYEDTVNHYSEQETLNLGEYFWTVTYDSEIAQIAKQLEKQTAELKIICKKLPEATNPTKNTFQQDLNNLGNDLLNMAKPKRENNE